VRVWDAAAGRLRASLPGPDGYTVGKFSPAADTIVVSSDEAARVRLWPVSARSAEVAVQLRRERRIEGARFDETGDRIVYVDGAGSIVVRELGSGRELRLGRTPDVVYGAEFSPDGRYVAGVPERDVLLWNLDRPDRPERVLEGHRGPVNALDYRADGGIVTAGADRTVRVWDPRDGSAMVMQGHEDEVTTTVFTADATKVLSSSQDGTIRLWDARTGVPLAVLQSGQGEVYDMALSRDGKIATLGKGEVVRVFNCDVCGSLEQVRARALSRSPGRLSAAERRQFLAAAE
ncbi:MAG: WD40 repeat domain-containing protein, partial [Solirubrobacteraceae bacterium]